MFSPMVTSGSLGVYSGVSLQRQILECKPFMIDWYTMGGTLI